MKNKIYFFGWGGRGIFNKKEGGLSYETLGKSGRPKVTLEMCQPPPPKKQ